MHNVHAIESLKTLLIEKSQHRQVIRQASDVKTV